MTGEESFGRYTLVERLGYGGMAEVFLARTTSIAGFEKLLAIKRLLPFCTEDRQTVDLLADEARITVQLTHPNIVQVFDFGQVDEVYYIAMEYVEGLDLKSLIQIDDYHSTPLPTDVALFVTCAILDALEFAHNRRDAAGKALGIIHRDVSPHNVLVSQHGQVKLTDFGVARAEISSHVSVVGDIRGKFSYMPPEQACGGEIDHRIDIFATGAVLYELLSGRAPFRSTSSGEQMSLLHKRLVPPSAFRRELPGTLDELTLRALRLEPERRFQSAKDFADSLRREMRRSHTDPLGPQPKLAALVAERSAARAQRRERKSDRRKMSLGEFAASAESLIYDGSRGQHTNEPTHTSARRGSDLDRTPSSSPVLEEDTSVAYQPRITPRTEHLFDTGPLQPQSAAKAPPPSTPEVRGATSEADSFAALSAHSERDNTSASGNGSNAKAYPAGLSLAETALQQVTPPSQTPSVTADPLVATAPPRTAASATILEPRGVSRLVSWGAPLLAVLAGVTIALWLPEDAPSRQPSALGVDSGSISDATLADLPQLPPPDLAPSLAVEGDAAIPDSRLDAKLNAADIARPAKDRRGLRRQRRRKIARLRSRRRSPRQRRAQRSSAKKGQFGYLTVSSYPWGVVEVNGRLTGKNTPLVKHRLPVGRYRVRVRFDAKGQYSKVRVVRITSGANTKLILRQQAKTPAKAPDADES